MTKVLSFILSALSSLNPTVSLLLTAGTLLVGMLKFVNTMWGILMAKVVALTMPPTVALTAMSGLGFADHVFPLHELFTFVVSYCGFYSACAVIRMIKSFIPTIA